MKESITKIRGSQTERGDDGTREWGNGIHTTYMSWPGMSTMLVEGDKGVYYAESHARARPRRYRAMDMNSRAEKDKEDGRTCGRGRADGMAR